MLLLKCIVEESAGGLREEGWVLALAWRVASIPGERRERQTASAWAREGISATGAFQECMVVQGGGWLAGYLCNLEKSRGLASTKAWIRSQVLKSQKVPSLGEASLCSPQGNSFTYIHISDPQWIAAL